MTNNPLTDYDLTNQTVPATNYTFSISNGGTSASPPAYNHSFGAWTTPPTTTSFESDVSFKGKVTIDGRDLVKTLATIEQRLSILVPDPAKLEKFEALRKAYEHYKTLEALCHGDDNE